MSTPPKYQWDAKNGRYRSGGGRFVSQKAVQRAADKYIGAAQDSVADTLFALLKDGQINVKDAQLLGERAIARANLVQAMAAKGGKAQMSQSDYGKVGSLVKTQLRYFRDRMKSIAAGQPLDGRVKQSFRAFIAASGATRQKFERGVVESRGFDEEKWLLNDGARHCSDCPRFAAMGWVKMGTLPDRGEDSECRQFCQCDKIYRSSVTGEIRE